MSQSELVRRIIQTLNGADIPYMITGSIASSLQGEPRSTHDIDIIIDLRPSAIDHLLEAFPPPDFYLNRGSIERAIKDKSMFNLIYVPEGDKADFWILTDEPFDRSRFARRIKEKALGEELIVSAPEDTILAKLRWAKLIGGSEKQFVDALRVYEVQYPNLDLGYLERWAQALSVAELWQRLKQEAEII